MRIAILGATGLVGRVMLRLLEARSWVDDPPLLLAGARSAGTALPFRGGRPVARDAATADLSGVRLALFSAGGAASREYGPRFAAAGAWVVDNSSAFRMDRDVPLVVPEVNRALVPRLDPDAPGPGGIIANPNCSTIQLAVPLAALHAAAGLREVQVTTLQAVSGAGRAAVEELARQLPGQAGRAARLAAGDLVDDAAPGAAGVLPRRLAGNVLPQIGSALPDGSFEEEAKVGRELRKILDLPALAVSCTATRVPVWNGHSAAVRVVLARPLPLEAARRALTALGGVAVDPSSHGYTTPGEASGDGTIRVGRLRHDPDRAEALLFWVVADNLLKGAALNAVQIADLLAGAPAPAR
ncbi:MAG: aspartate-semialdehyde dehydrogenase [Candidatus Krumholzibacteriia bacterium]